MPYKGDGQEFSIRTPNDLWQRIERHFALRNQSHLTKNAKVLTLLKDGLDRVASDSNTSQPKAEGDGRGHANRDNTRRKTN